MNAFYDFGHTIQQLRKEKKYDEALQYFKTHKGDYEKKEIGENSYVVSDILTCLRQREHYDAAFQFLHLYGVVVDEALPERVLSAYGWLLYDKYKAENETEHPHDHPDDFLFEEEATDAKSEMIHTKTELQQKIEACVVLLQNFDSAFSTNVLEFLFKQVMRTEKKRPRPAWSFVAEFCDKIDPDKLTTHCSTIEVVRKGERKEMELASAREEWFAFMSKALYETEQYERCFAVSKHALELFGQFHYNYDIWFARRIALCKREMGKPLEAIAELEAILKKKRDWFIRKELAGMYVEQGEYEKAFKQAIAGMAAFGDLEYKVELIEMTGDLFKHKGEEKTAYQHYMLVYLIREEEKWRIPENLLTKLRSFEGMPEYRQSDKPGLLQALKAVWNRESPTGNAATTSKPKTRIMGKVKKLLQPTEDGRAGFITKETGGDLFFYLKKEHRLYDKLISGLRVSFVEQPARNGKGDVATDIIAE